MNEFKKGIRVFLILEITRRHQFPTMRATLDEVIASPTYFDAKPRGATVSISPNLVVDHRPLPPKPRGRKRRFGHTSVKQCLMVDIVGVLRK